MKNMYLGITLLYFGLSFFSACSEDKTNEESGKGDQQGGVPEIETVEVSDVFMNSASAESKLISVGGSSILERGVCWAKHSTPTVDDFKTKPVVVDVSGEFSVQMEGLEQGTKYYVRAFATNDSGTGYGNEVSFTTVSPEVFLDSTSFDTMESFEQHWNMLYPWGEDHNGSARMYEDMVTLEENGVLLIKADRIYPDWEGYSTADPYLRIKYHSGAIHYNGLITVNDEYPFWEISGDFKAPVNKGTWPAFWITGANSWPPEVDILEFKGNAYNWQNTVTGPSWDQTVWTTDKTNIPDAPEQWHNYRMTMEKISNTDVQVRLFVDGELKGSYAKDFVNDPFHLIINLQMEGASGEPGPENTEYRARNIYLSAIAAE
jgi:FlaG/FlaF family flagellin (archaellin)